MPTSHCRYPDHHSGPSAGPPFTLLGAIGLTACIIGLWHSIVLILVCIALLAVLAGCVFLLIHNHGSGFDPELERQAALERAQTGRAAAYSVTGAQSPAVASAERREALEAAPVVHYHLHVDGGDARTVAQLVARRQDRPAQEERQPW